MAKSSCSVVVYPGTYDPITYGHLDIVRRALSIFDKVVILVSENSNKKVLFDIDERVELVHLSLKDASFPTDRIIVDKNSGFTVEYMKSHGYNTMIRGLRAVSDFEYEMQIALANKHLESDIETIFMVSDLKYQFLRSTIVREIARLGGKLEGLVTPSVEQALKKKFGWR
ncbi:MAG: pantetheine-phosphate adenylyltransferase [Planctomycetota bacterium]|nr:MAG: pantetheine-phosphate adenylyltransferase [Planctomycetota bacterium]